MLVSSRSGAGDAVCSGGDDPHLRKIGIAAAAGHLLRRMVHVVLGSRWELRHKMSVHGGGYGSTR